MSIEQIKLVRAIEALDLNQMHIGDETLVSGLYMDSYSVTLFQLLDVPARVNSLQLVYTTTDESIDEWYILLGNKIALSGHQFSDAFNTHVDSFVFKRKQMIENDDSVDYTEALKAAVDVWCDKPELVKV